MSQPTRVERGCDYCGLPIPGGVEPSVADEHSPGTVPCFCCFGCRFAAAVASDSGEEGQARWTLVRLGLAIFFSMIVMVFSMALWSHDVYDVGSAEATRALSALFRSACLLAAAPVLLLLGGPLLENAWDNFRQRRLATDALLVVGIVAAFGLSVRSVIEGHGPIYFEVACVVLVAVTLGRWLEATGRLKTTQALRSLEKLLPTHVRVVAFTAGKVSGEVTTPLDTVEVGQFLRVLPGERIPVDGILRRNQAAIDEQVVTGESQPSIKEMGDRVLAGTLNLDGDLWIEVSVAPREGTLQRLINAVCQAAMARSRIQRNADRIAAWFLPTVVLIAAITFAAHTLAQGVDSGVLASLAVLLIACPCALGIATPLAVWAAMGRAARAGVLFRNGDALHRLAGVRAVAFDKTGTLTTGEPELVEFMADEETSREQILAAAFQVASASSHSLSKAVRQFTQQIESSAFGSEPIAAQVRTRPGLGVVALLAETGGDVYLGSRRFMHESGLIARPAIDRRLESILESGQQLACIGWNGRIRGLFVFCEELREAVPEALAELRSDGYPVSVLTGDHHARAKQLAVALDVVVESELLPEDKTAAIRRLQSCHGAVAMVGDGINDAPALAIADIGIAMGCGADLSRDTADVCLLGNDLRLVAWSMRLARQTLRTVNQNLFWTFAYNVVGVGIAAAGWLNPIWAAAAMVLSSLFVITNSLKLVSDARPNSEDLLGVSSEPSVARRRNWNPTLDSPAATDRNGLTSGP